MYTLWWDMTPVPRDKTGPGIYPSQGISIITAVAGHTLVSGTIVGRNVSVFDTI